MKVKTVVVEVHEKFPHPTGEYAHYDVTVRMEAEVYSDESAGYVTEVLMANSRSYVTKEGARWRNQVLHDGKLDHIADSIRNAIFSAEVSDSKLFPLRRARERLEDARKIGWPTGSKWEDVFADLEHKLAEEERLMRREPVGDDEPLPF